MKKIVAILLALCTLFSLCFLVSCEKDTDVVENKEVEQEETKTPEGETTEEPVADEPVVEEPKADEPVVEEPVVETKASLYEIVNGAIVNTLAAGTYEAKVDTSIKADIIGNISTSTRNLTVKTDGTNISVEGKKNEYDYESEHKYYYDGSWMYFDMYGECYKRQAGLDEFSSEAGGIVGMIAALPEAAFATAVENGDVVEITLDEATAESIYRDVLVKLVYDIVGEDLNQTTTTLAKLGITVKDGYVSNFNLTLSTEILAGNDKAVYDYNGTIDFVSVGGAVSVQFPNGYQNFNELDWG